MKRKHTTVANGPEIRVVVVTLDNHLSDAATRARVSLGSEIPGLKLALHAASDWETDNESLESCRADITNGHIVIVTMLFMDDHIRAILPTLAARRDECDAMICCMSAPEVVKLTRMGRLSMDRQQSGPMSLLKRLRGNSKNPRSSAGAQQLSVLRKLPRILRFIPGTAQDLRAYFLTLQYWLAGSEENFVRMTKFLVGRYAEGPRKPLRSAFREQAPVDYPDVGVYHPRLKSRIETDITTLPGPPGEVKGTVGLLIMRSYVLAGNTAHYDAVIESLESRGLRTVTAFASGLDARPAVERFFMSDDKPMVDAIVSLTGFSLVGGPAYNDARAAEELLARMDVPYVAATPVELQSIDQWQESTRGLMPVESTMMVAIPEIDGATGSMVFAGRSAQPPNESGRNMQPHAERIEMLTARIARIAALRHEPRASRRLAVVLFNFPPNAGNTGTAAHLDVFKSLYNTLKHLQEEGYTVDMPSDVDDLRRRIIDGNASTHGTHANVHAVIDVDDHVRREPWLDEIEAQWGPAPGRHQTNGRSIFVLGAEFGNVFVGVQPAFGYEGDPMRLLFESGFAPTHAFTAFYSYIRETYGAHAVVHFGTHGALEFMPGKQVGLSGACWPDRLIGDLPNFYFYAANNPSEGMIAKRRSAATLISYLTPPVARAGLYEGLVDLKQSIDRWRSLPGVDSPERSELAELIQVQAAAMDLAEPGPAWGTCAETRVETLRRELVEVEASLIPFGLHVIGEPAPREERLELLRTLFEASHGVALDDHLVERIISDEERDAIVLPEGLGDVAEVREELRRLDSLLSEDCELPALSAALDGRFVRPAPGGDLLRNPEVLPTGRNLHGFDPFRLPSKYALGDGIRQARQLLERHTQEGNPLPESIALVLWGTDNLKTEGAPIAQALALIGAEPRLDSYGRVCGASLISLEELGRPRIDVVMTLSGIFRDLLPLQTRLLAEAAFLAASADEPVESNFVRKHALAYQERHHCDLEAASLRVFSNAEGAYGSNVNMTVDNGAWEDESELGEIYTRRKCYAYNHAGKPTRSMELLEDVLSDVDLAYQNLDSVELGITTVDHYFDTLGGISRAIKKSRGGDVPVYISDQTLGDGRVRTLSEQLALETRTRVLNPKWYESILKHGFEGVREIESHITNTVGWSATTGQVSPWVYERVSQTFLLDREMRERMAKLNPTASLRLANRLLEASDRHYWEPDGDTLDALRMAGEELEDRLEGITQEAAA